MMRSRYPDHYTICAKLRNLYQNIDDPEIRKELAICAAMAKKMHERLKYYKVKENEH